LYSPGQTLDPACAPTDLNCGIATVVASSTANGIPYYAANGSILSATSTVTILQNGNVGIGTTTPFTTFAVNGSGYFSNLILGTPLGVASGGTASTTLTGILKGAGTSAITTAIPGTDYLAPNSLSAAYPLQYSANNFSLAFGTTTANSWSALQQFNGNASTTQFTSTGSTYLATLGGNVGIGTISPSSLLTIQSSASSESAPLGAELTSSSGWTSTGWTGSYGGGFVHTPGNTSNLSQSLSISVGNYYLVRFTVGSMTAGSLNVSLGGTTSISSGGDLPSISNGAFSWSVYTTTTGALNFIPTSDFNGTISNISVKQVTGTYPATSNLNASNGSSDFEIRSAPTLVANAFGGPDVFLGESAGSQNVTGGMIVAVGTGAMQNNISGSEDVAIGYQSQNSAVAGWYNVSVGHFTLQHILNGYDNTAIGDVSMMAVLS